MLTVGLGIALTLSHHRREPISTRERAAGIVNRTLALRTLGIRITTDIETMLVALNEVRAEKGLRPLALDPQLCAIAQSHGSDMALRGYFDHTSPEGVSPFGRLDRAHYTYGYAGENLALDRDATSAHRALLGSTEHRENMLESHYVRVGIAAIHSPAGEIFVEDFSD